MHLGRRIFALVILFLSGVGVVAYAYSIALQNTPPQQNPCAQPPTASSTYDATFQATRYRAQNVTFTDVNQEQTLLGVQFAVLSIADPAAGQFQNGSCVTVTNSPNTATIKVRITYEGGST